MALLVYAATPVIVGPPQTIYISSSDWDDGHVYNPWGDPYPNGNLANENPPGGITYSNRTGTGHTSYFPYWRFRSINAPQGANITSAELRIRQTGSGTASGWTTGLDFRFYLEDTDDVAYSNVRKTIGNAVAYGARTTAYTSLNVSAVTNNYYYLDMTDVLQEVVGRPGWEANNNIRIHSRVQSGGDAVISYWYDYSHADRGRLTIEYEYVA